ncbi:hypothetical protein DNO_0378 [Dichelobacter nodosus VCS1703A]|uniref:Uncharacterized protein n=1 Tax=Dichelobacter nodosus (strain VCS1703A) TaxID=246195 RepID=A5EW04_DICNV|nr:hypothetical protein DNO_0378 [Dichelobacter nodosus VCS1703A]
MRVGDSFLPLFSSLLLKNRLNISSFFPFYFKNR